MGNFCSNCGNQLREGANFCNKCGNQVNVNPVANFPSHQLTNSNQFQNGLNQAGYYPYNNNQPNYGNYNSQLSNYQPNYSQIIIKENLTFGMAIRTWWYGTFEGRCSRWELWKTFFCLLPISILLYIFVVVLDNTIIKSKGIILNIYTLFITLITLKPGLSLTARRLHDLNMSGWWQIIFHISTPLILYSQYVIYKLNSSYYNRDYWTNILLITGIIIFIIFIFEFIFGLYFSFTSGTQGPNKYGPPSKY